MKPRNRIIALMLTLALTLSFVSAQANAGPSQQLAPNLESQTFGGGDCGARWGITLALGAATLSGCAALCGVAAWYSLLLLYNC
jgi:hypothetical protein